MMRNSKEVGRPHAAYLRLWRTDEKSVAEERLMCGKEQLEINFSKKVCIYRTNHLFPKLIIFDFH